MQGDRQQIGDELRQALRLLLRDGWIVLVCIVAAAGLGYLLSSSEDDRYEARAQVLVQAYAPDLTLPDTPLGFADPTRARATALQLTTIPEVALRVSRRLRLASGIPARVTTAAAGDSDVITIKARTLERRLAPDLANAYAEEYIAFRREANQERYDVAISAIEEKLAELGGRKATRVARSQLRRQIARLRLLQATQTGGAQLVQRASLPGGPVPGHEIRDTLLGGLAGLIFGLVLIVLRNRVRDRVDREDDLAELAPGIPVLGYVPAGRNRRSTGRVADGFHNLAMSLQSLRPDGGPRTILLTSAMAQDGKSSSAMNLALDLEQRGLDPLYVEVDLRRPTLTEVAEVEGSADGVRTVLSGVRTVEQTVVSATFEPTRGRSNKPRVAMAGTIKAVPAGVGKQAPQTLIGERTAASLLSRTREQAGYVILDGPPLGVVNDALPIAKRVDAVLIVVRLGHTRTRRLRRLLEQLANAQVAATGIVVIGAETVEYYR